MKNFLVVLFCAYTTVAYSNPIRVEGTGTSYQLAKQDGFNIAIEKAVGTVLLSQRKHRNDVTVKNDMTAYSSGYIDRYDVIDSQEYNGYYVLIMDVYVKQSKIANKLLTTPEQTYTYDNERHNDQLGSYRRNRNGVDNFVNEVMYDYPFKAYNLHQYPYQIKIDAYRNAHLIIPFRLSWNYNYLMAMTEMLGNIQEGHRSWRRRAISNIRVEAKNPENLVMGKTYNYGFNDLNTVNLIKNNLMGDNEVRLKLEITDYRGNVVVLRCYRANYPNTNFYALYNGDNLSLFGNVVYKDFVSVKLNNTDTNFQDVSLTVTNAASCKNRI